MVRHRRARNGPATTANIEQEAASFVDNHPRIGGNATPDDCTSGAVHSAVHAVCTEWRGEAATGERRWREAAYGATDDAQMASGACHVRVRHTKRTHCLGVRPSSAPGLCGQTRGNGGGVGGGQGSGQARTAGSGQGSGQRSPGSRAASFREPLSRAATLIAATRDFGSQTTTVHGSLFQTPVSIQRAAPMGRWASGTRSRVRRERGGGCARRRGGGCARRVG